MKNFMLSRGVLEELGAVLDYLIVFELFRGLVYFIKIVTNLFLKLCNLFLLLFSSCYKLVIDLFLS